MASLRPQVTNRLLFSGSPVPYWLAALLTTSSDKDLVPIRCDEDEAKAKTKEEAAKMRRTVWFKVERARNLDTRHATILLDEVRTDGDLASCLKLYFLGYSLIGAIAFCCECDLM